MIQRVWTIGHSTRTTEELVSVLEAHEIHLVADVRRFPGSRRLPHFGADALRENLALHDIHYTWLPTLGGRRRAEPDSPNVGWRHPAFRAYADHIATAEFADGLFELLMLASATPTAIMCSELLWWRCHRRLIADVLVFNAVHVTHIYDADKSEEHIIREPASIVRGQLRYA